MKIKIKDAKVNDDTTNCAVIALASAFGVDTQMIETYLISHNINFHATGVFFYQLKKALNYFAKGYHRKITYYPNKAKISYRQLMLIFPDRKLLVYLDEHLSHYEDGTLYDCYIKAWKPNIDRMKVIGWWLIEKP